MSDQDTTLVALETARALAASFASSLPSSVDPAMLTLRSKLPFKALSVRELLLHRISALATAATQLFEQGNYLSGIVVTRAILETVAIAFALRRSLHQFARTRDIAKLDHYLMRLLVPSGAPGAKHQAMEIGSLIEAVDKKIPGFRNTYHLFSEYVHPNWSGLLGSFGTVDESSLILRLGMSDRSAAWGVGVHALAGLLAEFQDLYNEIPDLITEMNEYFETV